MDTKSLRQKILDLAIRGKLVPQDPNDEPASVLLERIRAEKQQMVKDGKLKAKDIKGDSVIFKGEDNLHYEKMADGAVNCIENEIPFEIPEGWSWARLGFLAFYKKGPFGSSITKAMFVPDSAEAIKVYEQKNAIYKDESMGNYYITPEKFQELKGFEVFPDDIIVSCAGTIGESFVMPASMRRGVINQALMRIMLYDKSQTEFYLLYFDFVLKSESNEKGKGTAMKNIPPFDVLKQFLMPIPPITEQKRILSCIKQLTDCVNNIDDEKLDISLLITQTKSKILDLAIRGNLVPQDPADEPASVLLERIRAEKEQLIKEGKIKRDKNESYIFRGDDKSYYQNKAGKRICFNNSVPFEIPIQWEWCQLGELCDYGNCSNIDTASLPDDAWILDLEDIEKDTGRVVHRVYAADRKSSSTKHGFHKGQLLYSKLRPYLNKVLIADEHGFCTSEILPLEFANILFPPYARHVLMSGYFLSYANKCSYGVKMPRLGTYDGKQAWIPIPPLPEQHRIVTAIDAAFTQLDAIADTLA